MPSSSTRRTARSTTWKYCLRNSSAPRSPTPASPTACPSHHPRPDRSPRAKSARPNAYKRKIVLLLGSALLQFGELGFGLDQALFHGGQELLGVLELKVVGLVVGDLELGVLDRLLDAGDEAVEVFLAVRGGHDGSFFHFLAGRS